MHLRFLWSLFVNLTLLLYIIYTYKAINRRSIREANDSVNKQAITWGAIHHIQIASHSPEKNIHMYIRTEIGQVAQLPPVER